jgi:hypothetical protein
LQGYIGGWGFRGDREDYLGWSEAANEPKRWEVLRGASFQILALFSAGT